MGGSIPGTWCEASALACMRHELLWTYLGGMIAGVLAAAATVWIITDPKRSE